MSNLEYRRIGIYCNLDKPQVKPVTRQVYERLLELGAEPVFSREIEECAGAKASCEDICEVCASCDALVVLGGDGTLLRAARECYPYGIPILGVNLGYLGFLAETTVDSLDEPLERLVHGSFQTSSRIVLWVTVFQGGNDQKVFESPVVNEVLLFRRAKGRIIELPTFINGEILTRYRADGILISTPTGSTGHSLSAGGPILKPEMRAILITPLNPHTLASRSIVIEDSDDVRVDIDPDDRDVSLTVDGQDNIEVPAGAHIEVTCAPRPITLVRPGQRSFYELLRKKLYLGAVSAREKGETP
jgi:NAD+ kinase